MDITTARGITLVNGRHLTLQRVTPEGITDMWHHLVPLLEKGEEALAPLGTFKDVFENCQKGYWQFFIILENGAKPIAGMITEVQKRPDGRALVLLWIAGSGLKSFMKFYPTFEKWARVANCDYFEALTRKGLTRILPKIGFETEQYVMRKRFKK